jgi:HK97 gp10 family phage protein
MGQVSNNIEQFLKDLDRKYLYEGMTKACALVQTDARKRCPKDTGNLRRSIDFEVEEDGSEGVIYSNAEYAPYVEIGTGIYSSKGNGRKTPWKYRGSKGWVTTKGNKPQPFLEPAAQSNRSDIQDCFKGLI